MRGVRWAELRLSVRLLRAASVLCALAALLCAAASPARGDALPPPTAVAHDGFGDARNSYAWSMAWFKGALYVGTARSALCVENATIDLYLPNAGFYRREPRAGVACPPSIHQADLRAEIWRHVPGTGRWTRVYRSPRVPNPRAPGRSVAQDIGYRGMVVADEPRGGEALYVAAMSPDELIPELRRPHPPRLLRTTDGRRFRALPARPPVIHTALGRYRPVGFRALATVGGSLYVTASSGLTGDGVVLRVDRPGGRSPSMTQVSPPALRVFELAAFGGRLYAGTGDPKSGYGLWRAEPERSGRWDPVVTGGAGRGAAVTSVVTMAPYRGRLYVGASGWGTSAFPASELISVAGDGSWDVVVGDPRHDARGRLRAPLSGLSDGFGNAYNHHFWRLQEFRGALLLGTNDWSGSLRGVPGVPDQVRAEFGFDLYGTCDGSRWWAATRDGFGRQDDFGARTMAASPAGLFIGTTNHVRGTSVLRSSARPCAPAPTGSALLARRASATSPEGREPRSPVAASRLAQALTCFGEVGPGRPPPILVVPGTGSDGSQVHALGRGAFDAIGRTVCALNLPDRATADMQISVHYVVHAIRTLSRRAGRPIAVAGISQGGVLARTALTYWPSLRAKVADVVTAAAPHHGVRAQPGGRCLAGGCPAALWQQWEGSRFMRALNDGRDETPGRTAYTTVRSLTDEVVRPQTGRRPTSALRGAVDVLIQDVCPGRTTTHIGTAVDSVTIAALQDAVTHPGPARPSRFARDVCDHPYGTGLDEQRTRAFLDLAAAVLRQGSATAPAVRVEPPVKRWMKRRT